MFQICTTVGGKRICKHIPTLIVTFPGTRPDPFLTRVADATRLIFRPEPEPWVTVDLATLGLAESVIRDARILATIEMLTAELSPSLRAGVGESVKAAARKLTLPQDADFTIAA